MKLILVLTSLLVALSFSIFVWSPNLNGLELPSYRTIGESGIVNSAFWVGLKLGLIARDKNIFVLNLPLISLNDKSFSKSVFLQLSYCNSFIKGLHTAGITVIASPISKNTYLINNMDYDFLFGKYSEQDLKNKIAQYSYINVRVSKALEDSIENQVNLIYLRSIKKLKLTTLPYDCVKILGKYNISWSCKNCNKSLSISATPIKCDTLFIVGDQNVNLNSYENVFRIFQFNKKIEDIIKGIVLGDLFDKLNF
jgi:NADPH-dependent 7-cyano-7-deazaguanine reductase QueF-like protein